MRNTEIFAAAGCFNDFFNLHLHLGTPTDTSVASSVALKLMTDLIPTIQKICHTIIQIPWIYTSERGFSLVSLG